MQIRHISEELKTSHPDLPCKWNIYWYRETPSKGNIKGYLDIPTKVWWWSIPPPRQGGWQSNQKNQCEGTSGVSGVTNNYILWSRFFSYGVVVLWMFVFSFLLVFFREKSPASQKKSTDAEWFYVFCDQKEEFSFICCPNIEFFHLCLCFHVSLLSFGCFFNCQLWYISALQACNGQKYSKTFGFATSLYVSKYWF